VKHHRLGLVHPASSDHDLEAAFEALEPGAGVRPAQRGQGLLEMSLEPDRVLLDGASCSSAG